MRLAENRERVVAWRGAARLTSKRRHHEARARFREYDQKEREWPFESDGFGWARGVGATMRTLAPLASGLSDGVVLLKQWSGDL